jgi:hypothetical protein
MYKVKNVLGFKTTRTKFFDYEKARQWVRKQIRLDHSGYSNNDLFWTSNPQIGDYGYRINKV